MNLKNRSLLTREMEKEFNRRKARATIEALTGVVSRIKKTIRTRRSRRSRR
jgi:hypothetical protein